jgi:rod shape determining protein RodA
MIELGGYGRDRQLWRHVPWAVFVVTAAICVISLVNLYSASRTAHAPVWISQAVWMAGGLLGAFALLSVDYRFFHRIAWPLYAVTVVMLVAVELHGVTVMGAQRWLVIGPMRVQPSEIAKLATVFVLARYFHEEGELPKGHGFLGVIPPAVIIGIPYALTVIQPDLGTATMLLAICGTMVLASKVRWQVLATAGLGGVAVAAVGWLFLLHDYQRKRVLTFLDPESDALGAGYHANQSMIAVGSGQWAGKGWGAGSQTQLSFLPEQHTDFVFSVFAEEWGYRGAVILLALFLVLVVLGLQIAAQARDRHGAFLAIGATALIFWHVFVNIGMVSGLLPVVGVTLPLMSYGGSSVLTVMIAVGVLANVGARRFGNAG